MGNINRNNFLRWSGQMNETVPVLSAVDDGIAMPQGQDYVEIDPFANDSANLGIDVYSLVIVSISEPSAPLPKWNEATNKLRIFRPKTGGAVLMTLQYYFKDFLGNASNVANIVVTLAILPTGYRGYAPSRFCVQNSFGQNTGQQAYAQLEKYYPSTGTVYVPHELIANAPGMPYYIAPVTNTTACPLPSMVSFQIVNNSNGTDALTVHGVTLYISGTSTYYAVNIPFGHSQTIFVPTSFYSSCVVAFTHVLSGGLATGGNWQFNNGTSVSTGTISASGSSFTVPTPAVTLPAVALIIS